MASAESIEETISKLETGEIRDYSNKDVRDAISFLDRSAGNPAEKRIKSSIEISIRIIEARPYHFILSEALDLLSKSIKCALPTESQLKRFIKADLLNDGNDGGNVWQFGRSRAITVFLELIERANEPKYAELAAFALAAQSKHVTVHMDMRPLAGSMEQAADNKWPRRHLPAAKAKLVQLARTWRHGHLFTAKFALKTAASALREKTGHRPASIFKPALLKKLA